MYPHLKNFFIIFSILTLFAVRAHAATLSLTGPTAVSPAGTVPITVLIDGEGASINSVDVTISFSSSHYAFAGYVSEGGAIPLWISTPKEIEAGKINFSGVIPGGIERVYDPHHPEAQTVPLTRLLFTARDTNDVTTFSIDHAILLLNDGKGSEVAARWSGASVVIRGPASVQGTTTAASDPVPPVPFSIDVIEGSVLGKTPRLAVFAATDGESGIARYEGSVNGTTFRAVQSPYPLPRRLLPYTLTVRAVDFSGNVRDARVAVAGDPLLKIVIVLCIGAAIVIYICWLRRKRNRRRALYP